jgi:hypothetical protein
VISHSPPQVKRLLVTVSRTWQDWDRMREGLFLAWHPDTILVHGAAPHGDMDAERIWRDWGGRYERWQANWRDLGRRAGFVRNAAMVGSGIDVCLAFIRDGSAGASHTAALAEEAGIPTRRFVSVSEPVRKCGNCGIPLPSPECFQGCRRDPWGSE